MGITGVELDLIVWLQEIGGLLEPVMKLFSMAGYSPLYVLVIPFLFFVVDARLAFRVAFFQFFNMLSVALFKQLFRLPRPYWLDHRITSLDRELSFGMPSGHAAGSVFWLYLAEQLKKGWIWVAAVVVTLMIGISRIFLGVHFPTQVLAGWFLGGTIFLLFIKCETAFVNWFLAKARGVQLTFAVVVPNLFVLLGLLSAWLLREWQMPEQWIANTVHLMGDGWSLQGAVTLKNVMLFGGALTGVSIAATLLHWSGGIATNGSILIRLARYFVSSIFVVAVLVPFLVFSPDKSSPVLYYLSKYLQFFLVSMVGFYLMPLFLRKVGLAQAAEG